MRTIERRHGSSGSRSEVSARLAGETTRGGFRSERFARSATLLPRIDWIFLAFAAFLALFSASASGAPNIILILADDLGWSDLRCYGNAIHDTPNLDRFAAEGVRFTGGYASAPICSASRASILTGKTTARLGFEFVTKDEPGRQKIAAPLPLAAPPFTLDLSLDEETIPETIAKEGYVSGFFGKWHLNRHHGRYLGWSPAHGPLAQGFDFAIEGFGSHPYGYTGEEKREPFGQFADGEFPEDGVTRNAIEFLEERGGEPFFLLVSHFYVHTPVRTRCRWLLDKYRARIPESDPRREMRAVYGAFVETLDHYAGELLDAIDDLGFRENTLVIFTSDNGGHPEFAGNAPLRGSKWNLYEGGVRVPFMARWPGVTAPGSVCKTPVIGYDLHSTICDAAGIAPAGPDERDGVSFLPLLENPGATLDRSLFWHFPYYHPEKGFAEAPPAIGVDDGFTSQTRPQTAMRRGDRKLVYFHETGRGEVYDLGEDVAEQKGIAGKVEAASLRSELKAFLHEAGARLPEKSPEYMLELPGTGADPEKIDFAALPVLKGEHAVISEGDPEWKFRLHNYLARFDGKFWCFWSHGPVIEDKATQHLRYSTSEDGTHWTTPEVLAGPPRDGYGYIARGLWIREGKLIALASLFEAPGYHDGDLELVAFRWDESSGAWKPLGRVWDDTLNNFAPKKLPTGEWMMSRRSSDRSVSIMIGGVDAIDDWEVIPFSAYELEGGGRPEEPFWWVLPGGDLAGLFRDNGGSMRLLRSFSKDNGRTWTPMVRTNFPDARSKFNALRASDGRFVLVSNPNPKGRRPLCLSVSHDGLVFNRMAVLPIPSGRGETLQYPHLIEHEGHLLVAFSRNKTAIEVVKVPLGEVEELCRQAGLE